MRLGIAGRPKIDAGGAGALADADAAPEADALAKADADADALAAAAAASSSAALGVESHQISAVAKNTAPSKGSQRGDAGSAATGWCDGRSSPLVGRSWPCSASACVVMGSETQRDRLPASTAKGREGRNV